MERIEAVLKSMTRLMNKEGNPNWRLVTDHGTFTSGSSSWGFDVDPWWVPGDVLVIEFGEGEGERFSVKKKG